MQKSNWKSLFFYLALVCLMFCGIVFFQTFSYASASTLPSSFSLFEIDNMDCDESLNMPKNVGDQGGTTLCWAFASLTAFETTLYKTYPELLLSPINFSELDMAYNLLVEKRNQNSVNRANFELAYEYLSSEDGPMYEQTWEKNSEKWANNYSATSFYAQNKSLYGTEEANFSAFESKIYPCMSYITGIEQKEELRNSIKSHIRNYGAVCASIFYNESAYYDITSNAYFCPYSANANHMITLVGWDDEFEYAGHTGAYIAQNSYGEDFGDGGFFYVMFDDACVEDGVMGYIRVGQKLEDFDYTSFSSYNNSSFSQFENQFQTYLSSSSIYSSSLIVEDGIFSANIYEKENRQNEKIVRLKIPTICPLVYQNYVVTGNYEPTIFSVYVLDNLPSLVLTTTANISLALSDNFENRILVRDKNGSSIFETNQTGFYTIELGENEIELNGDYFAIIIETKSGYLFFMDNNSDGFIPTHHRTFVSENGTQNWSYYMDSSSGDECVLPLIIQTASTLSQIEYEIDDQINITYSGEDYFILPTILYPSNAQICYVYDNKEYLQSPAFVDSGEYVVEIILSCQNFREERKIVHLTISKKEITITPLPSSKIYGEQDDLSFEIIGEDIKNLIINGRLSREEGEDVGEYEISIGSLAISSKIGDFERNYDIKFTSGVMLTITKRTLFVSPNYVSQIYGEEEKPLSYNYSNTIGQERPNLTLILYRAEYNGTEYVETSNQDAGTYAILYRFYSIRDSYSGFKASNYNFVYTDFENKYEILPRELVIIPDAKEKDYGAPDPVFTYTFSNNIEGETPKFVNSISRVPGEDTGVYEMLLGALDTVDNGDFLRDNYILRIDKQNHFSILYGNIANYSVESYSTTYDGEGHYPIVECDDNITAEYLVNDEYTTSAPSFVDSGTYSVLVRFSAQNYRSVTATCTVTILPRQIVISPFSASKIYGEEDNISFIYSGNLPSQIPLFKGSLHHIGSEDTGTYSIGLGSLSLAENGSFNPSNHTLVLADTNSNFIITKRCITIFPNANQQKEYNSADKTIVFSLSNVLELDAVSFVGALSREDGENVGEYPIYIGSLNLNAKSSKNYYIELSSEIVYFTIYPATISIKIDDKYVMYGELDTSFSFVVTQNADKYDINDNLSLVYTGKDSLDNDVNSHTIKNENGYEISAKSYNQNYIVQVTSGRYYVVYPTYNVLFDIFGESYASSCEQFSNPVLPQGATTDVIGYDFICWKTENGEYIYDLSKYVVTGSILLTAEFSAIKYNINYVLFGGEFLQTPSSYYLIYSFVTLPIPEQIGYDFAGWHLNSAFDSEITSFYGSDFAEDITVFAKWTPKTYSATLSQNIFSGVNVFFSQSATYGESFTFTITLDRECDKSYSTMSVFVKWQKTGEREKVLFSMQNVTDLSLTKKSSVAVCKFNMSQPSAFEIEIEGVSVNTYEITFVVEGEVLHREYVTHGESSYALPRIPAREHFTQVQPYWTQENFENVTSDINSFAVYTPDTYVVLLVDKQGKTYTQSVTYGENADTSLLYKNYPLGFMEHFSFSTSPNNISKNEVIYFAIESDAYTLCFVIITLLVVFIAFYVTISLVHYKKRRKNK